MSSIVAQPWEPFPTRPCAATNLVENLGLGRTPRRRCAGLPPAPAQDEAGPMTTSPRVTVLGTGAIGYGMSVALLRHHLDTTVWNRTRAKAEPLAEFGATVADDPVSAVAHADVVVTALFDADADAAVMTQVLPRLAPGAVWVQSSTVGPTGTARLAALAGERDVPFVDAPVLGTRKPALAGQLVVLAAAPAGVRPRVQPVFDAIATRTLWVADEPGPASRLKLVANAWIAVLTAGIGQSIALARAWGLDPQLFLDAIDGSQSDSPYAHVKGPAMLSGDFAPQFELAGLRKDLALAAADARTAGVPTELIDTLARAYATAAAAGSPRDIAAVIDAFRPTSAQPHLTSASAGRP
ncbi:MAG: NAD(P)-dependent oxidoreductase, partial [Micrococcales bacterium]|nr:NAD(P)-dependent oxidoreductase [Micrococcales bacterium]